MADEPKRKTPSGPAPASDDLSWNDWEERTEQRDAPSSELLEAMKQPDMPPVVLEAIARRSSVPSVPPPPEAPVNFDENTERYLLPKGAPIAARMAQRGARERPEEPLTTAFVLGVLFVAAVGAWFSFGILSR